METADLLDSYDPSKRGEANVSLGNLRNKASASRSRSCSTTVEKRAEAEAETHGPQLGRNLRRCIFPTVCIKKTLGISIWGRFGGSTVQLDLTARSRSHLNRLGLHDRCGPHDINTPFEIGSIINHNSGRLKIPNKAPVLVNSDFV